VPDAGKRRLLAYSVARNMVLMDVATKPLKADVVRIAAAARAALEDLTPSQKGMHFAAVNAIASVAVVELMGRLILEQLGRTGRKVIGYRHPSLGLLPVPHAWLEIDDLIIDLTHDRFDGTGLVGWVFEQTAWHASFSKEVLALCFKPWLFWPYATCAMVSSACEAAK